VGRLARPSSASRRARVGEEKRAGREPAFDIRECGEREWTARTDPKHFFRPPDPSEAYLRKRVRRE